MTIFNKRQCATNRRNTGYRGCVLDIKFIRGAFLVPPAFKLTAAQMATPATVRAALEAAIIADKSIRIYPVPGFRTITDNSEDPISETLGDGSIQYIRDGNNNWLMQYFDGAMCLSNALRSFNGSGYRLLFWDDQNILFGTKVQETDGSYSVMGVPMDSLFFPAWKVNTGAASAQYRIFMSFQPKYVNELIGYVELDFPLSDLSGLVNMIFEPNSSLAGVINFSAYAGCDAENMYDEYSAELADPALFVVTNDTGGVIAATVAAVAGTKSFNLTLDELDPNYPPLATALVTVTPGSAADFEAAGIPGFEGLPFTYKRG